MSKLFRFGGCILLCLAANAPASSAQSAPDAELLALIDAIMAVDNHSHATGAESVATALRADDPLGTSPPFFSARQRETNPEWRDAWRMLYRVSASDGSADHIRQAVEAKQRTVQVHGSAYPSWILDQAGIDIALINAPHLGPGLSAPRFRWVPYGDGFLFPFPAPANFWSRALVQQHRTDVGMDGRPAAWPDFLALIDTRLREWKASGAVAVKFRIAYLRPLEFSNPPESEVRGTYEQYVEAGDTLGRDYRTTEYRKLQDFVFRYVLRQAGNVGLVVHIHTGEGGGPLFGLSGANPLLLESVVNDVSLARTSIVLVHGGFPFDRTVTSLLQKPNVYVDISALSFFRTRRDLSEILRMWLWSFPEKVLFGTDAFALSPLRGWEEMTLLASRSGRDALAVALSGMMEGGEINRSRAEEIARLVLRENAVKLYGLEP